LVEKIGHIKNPLTVIAIFAGIAEISGTTVLPFIEPENQSIYIWFLMIFPFFLVGIFFITLNFNRRALYAPSDYKDEKHFIFHEKNNNKQRNSFEEIKLTLEQIKNEEDRNKLKNKINDLELKLEDVELTNPNQLDQNEVLIDLEDIGKGLISTGINKNDLFQSLLNSIYFEFLFQQVPTFSYGRKWQLVDLNSNKVIAKHGDSDTRTLSEAGIEEGNLYKVQIL